MTLVSNAKSPFPVTAEINGVAVVTIPLADYAEMLKLSGNDPKRNMKIAAYRSVSRSVIARRPEIAEFILSSLVTQTISEIAVSCSEKFGGMAPSRSAIYRFVEQLKGI